MQLCIYINCNVRLQLMDELSAPRNIMPMIVFICQHRDEQQFRNTVMFTLRDFFSDKVMFMHTSTVTRSHFSYEKRYAYASHTSCFFTNACLREVFCLQQNIPGRTCINIT